MAFIDTAKTVFELPGRVAGGLAGLVFGEQKPIPVSDSNEYSNFDEDLQPKRPKAKHGVLTLVLDTAKGFSRAIGTFIKNHHQAMSIAFWASLTLAGAAALTLFLWPAALTAVAGVTVFGLSIAGIAGANALAQIGLAAALTFAATSAATYLAATVVNAFTAVKDFFKARKAANKHDEEHSLHSENDEDYGHDGFEHTSSARKMSGLGAGSKEDLDVDPHQYQSHSPILQHKQASKPDVQEEIDSSLTATRQNQ